MGLATAAQHGGGDRVGERRRAHVAEALGGRAGVGREVLDPAVAAEVHAARASRVGAAASRACASHVNQASSRCCRGRGRRGTPTRARRRGARGERVERGEEAGAARGRGRRGSRDQVAEPAATHPTRRLRRGARRPVPGQVGWRRARAPRSANANGRRGAGRSPRRARGRACGRPCGAGRRRATSDALPVGEPTLARGPPCPAPGRRRTRAGPRAARSSSGGRFSWRAPAVAAAGSSAISAEVRGAAPRP